MFKKKKKDKKDKKHKAHKKKSGGLLGKKARTGSQSPIAYKKASVVASVRIFIVLYLNERLISAANLG